MRSLRRPAAAFTGLLVVLVGAAGCRSSEPDLGADALYRVEVEQCQGVETQLAHGVAVGPRVVATVAHSLEGAAGITLRDHRSAERAAEVVYLDQGRDIALLRLAEPNGAPLTLADPVADDTVTILTIGDDGAVPSEATILDLVTATLGGEGRRAAIKLRADVKPGDSGAPVVDDQGRMVGLIFATARGDDVGWAVASSEIDGAVARLSGTGPEPLTLGC